MAYQSKKKKASNIMRNSRSIGGAGGYFSLPGAGEAPVATAGAAADEEQQ
jgi:hypothetical protein